MTISNWVATDGSLDGCAAIKKKKRRTTWMVKFEIIEVNDLFK